MTTIVLPPDLENRLGEEATRRGTTVEGLAVEELERLFPPKANGTTTVGTLFDLLADRIGKIKGTGESLSEDCGRRFTEGLVAKQQQGKL